jgi:hypothetical protein
VNNIQKLTAKEATQKDRCTSSKKKLEIHKKKTIYNIKENHLIIKKADKGNTLVILHEDTYNNKN